MSVNDIFNTAPAGTYNNFPAPAQAAPAPASAAGQPGNIPVPMDPNAPLGAAPIVPVVAEPKEPDSPLEPFKNLWETDPNRAVDPNAPVAPVALTAEDIQTAVSSANFAGEITADQMTAITAGGEDALTAMQAMMNTVARNVMTQTTLVGSRLADKRVAEAVTASEAGMSALVRKHNANSNLLDTNPLFSNPAIKPVIDATQHALLQKFPTATPSEITKMTQDYIVAMSSSLNPAAPAADVKGPDGETNWGAFFDLANTPPS